MEKVTLNKNLHSAKNSKNDEYYTQLADIERELKYYKNHFKGKVVYCNCDDPRISNFFHYFSSNFKILGLKKQITNNGDFRNSESLELLKQADIVVTNPPFSLFKEYVAQLMEHDKKFIIIGNINAISYKECFEAIKENKMWLGYNCVRHFAQPDGSMFETARTFWYTNLDISKRHEDLILYKKYYGNEEEYPTYDNYDAINVDKAKDIPMDYSGAMGVPITFLDKYNPEQFEIITLGIGEDNFVPTKKYGKFRDAITGLPSVDKRDFLLYIRDKNGKYLTTENYRVNKVYARIIIKNKNSPLYFNPTTITHI